MRLRAGRRAGQGSGEGCGGCVVVVVVAGLAIAAANGGCGGPAAGDKGTAGGGANALVNAIDRGITFVREAPTRVEPPVGLSVEPFLFLRGYYLVVRNASGDTLKGVVVTYVAASGNTVTQAVGDLPPGRAVRLDPSDVRWQVERNERVRVSADGYLSKTVETNALIP